MTREEVIKQLAEADKRHRERGMKWQEQLI